ncbi:MAG TPA: YkgJ family cysteine cluster protein [Desulfurivibrionaceae bacterium]|nr:YkgJ family cysteine cluster protein [Desulfurivibrionaceae bacterium]
MSRSDTHVDLTRTATWTRYRQSLCAECQGWCCRLPVEVRVEDLLRMEIIDAFEADEAPKVLAKRLRKSGIIDHFNFKNSLFTLARRANDDCIYLDAQSRRCTIYERRPPTCRNLPNVGPRPGYCAFREQETARPARRV